MQVLEQAVNATGSLDDELLSQFCRNNEFETVIGNMRVVEGGEWTQPRVVQVQFQHINNHEADIFRDSQVQVVVAPPEYVSGNFIYPYSNLN